MVRSGAPRRESPAAGGNVGPYRRHLLRQIFFSFAFSLGLSDTASFGDDSITVKGNANRSGMPHDERTVQYALGLTSSLVHPSCNPVNPPPPPRRCVLPIS